MIAQPIAAYLAFLLTQMQGDAAVLNKTWVWLTVIPFFLYALYMGFKWYLLLAPITIPLTTWLVLRDAPTTLEKKLWSKN